jgi:hypothetical protein
MSDQFVIPINRDRGKAYIYHSGNPDHETIRLQFLDRYGFEPEEIFQEFGYTVVGPAPDRIEAMELDSLED